MSDKLKPCAHCAKLGIEVEQIRRGDFHEWSIECSCCCCRTDWYGSREAAVAAWNKRADEPSRQAVDSARHQIDALRAYYGAGKTTMTDEQIQVGMEHYRPKREYGFAVVDELSEQRPVDNAQADSRERLEADICECINARSWGINHDYMISCIVDWLARQAAITEREIYKREQFHEKTQDMVEQIETQGIEIDGLIAERDGLRRELETQEHLAGQASRDYLRVLDRADKLQERVDSLSAERDYYKRQLDYEIDQEQIFRDGCEALEAERDELRGYAAEKIDELTEKQHAIDVQRESFRKMEKDCADMSKALDKACKEVTERTGSCPYDIYDVQPVDCADKCTSDPDGCWRLYFEGVRHVEEGSEG